MELKTLEDWVIQKQFKSILNVVDVASFRAPRASTKSALTRTSWFLMDSASLKSSSGPPRTMLPPRIDALVLTLTYDVETRLIEAQNPTFGASDGSRDHKDIV